MVDRHKDSDALLEWVRQLKAEPYNQAQFTAGDNRVCAMGYLASHTPVVRRSRVRTFLRRLIRK